MVVEVVQRLLDGLFPAHTIDEDVVGMSRHMEGLASLLEMESEKEVRFVGIWGMGGVGKTTIAKYLYSRFSRQFQDRCFISDVKKDYKERKLPYLRKKFLSEILGDERLRLGRGPCPNGFEQLTIRASRLAHGLPYALHSYSSQLHNITSAEEWEKALLKYEKSPDSNIFRFLRSSYEALTPRDKIAFLHVACLFNGHHSLRASSLLDDGESRIENLVQKSLVDISAQGCINMHGLVEEMGRELVVEESGYIIQKQRILWGNDVYDVLLDNTGTKRIEGLALDTCEIRDVLHIVHSNYNSIPNMKYLNFYTHSDDKRSKVELIPREASLPRKLRLLRWDAYPLTSLPSFPRDLIELTLRRSNLQTLCISDLGLGQLKRLDVTGSKNLIEIPDLSRATELEELIMKGCRRLEKIPENDSPSRIQTQATPANHIDASQSSKATNFSCKPIHRGENTHRVNTSQG
ncbi:hypothetical protein Bca52824_083160 [Brassica carinata]|uniref:Disease resistance protein n=1 Tax=Brassica carinata TaxID=52824 RepID=A0A8X7PIL0_BRACI|nr:hypothetical protein Bca52824_083160 [Brassica carinata]